MHQRLQRVELGVGIEEHLSEIYQVTAQLDDCFAYCKAEMGVYLHDEFDIKLTDDTPYAAQPYNCSPADLAFQRSEVAGLIACNVA